MLSKQVRAQERDAGGGQPAASREGRRRAKPRRIDPGDAVPQGVAVEEPAPLDSEVEIARDNLEAHLHDEERSG